MSARDDPIGNAIGSGGKEKYGEISYLPGESKLTSNMTVLWGGIEGGVNDVSPKMPAQNININQLGLGTGQSDGAPPPGVLIQFPQGLQLSDNAPFQGALVCIAHGET